MLRDQNALLLRPFPKEDGRLTAVLPPLSLFLGRVGPLALFFPLRFLDHVGLRAKGRCDGLQSGGPLRVRRPDRCAAGDFGLLAEEFGCLDHIRPALWLNHDPEKFSVSYKRGTRLREDHAQSRSSSAIALQSDHIALWPTRNVQAMCWFQRMSQGGAENLNRPCGSGRHHLADDPKAFSVKIIESGADFATLRAAIPNIRKTARCDGMRMLELDHPETKEGRHTRTQRRRSSARRLLDGRRVLPPPFDRNVEAGVAFVRGAWG